MTTLATAGTTLLSLSFVFAVTCQEFLGSCIFLFVKHPYDVGDRVDIQGPEKQQLIVEKISLLFTVFTRIDKMQVVQVPNITLNGLWIENVTRSKAMQEIIDINVSFDTSFEDLELLQAELEKFVRQSENARDFQPDLTITVAGVGDLDKLCLKIAIKHKSNWHNEAVRASRRSKIMCALALALKKIPIYNPGGGGEPLGGPANPQYSVAVDDKYAIEARARADEAKEAKRMVPTNPVRSDSTASKDSTQVEQEAADHLNARDPLQGAVGADQWAYDPTLNSRDASADRKRSHDIESLRNDLKLRRGSTRGRRKPGEALPATPISESVPGVTLSQYQSNRAHSFDVEAGVGLPGPSHTQSQHSGQQAYGGVPQPGNPANTGYTVYPTTSNPYFSQMSPPPHQTLATVPEPSPVAQAQAPPSNTTSHASGSSGVVGARPRGASITRPQPGQVPPPPAAPGQGPAAAPGRPAGGF